MPDHYGQKNKLMQFLEMLKVGRGPSGEMSPSFTAHHGLPGSPAVGGGPTSEGLPPPSLVPQTSSPVAGFSPEMAMEGQKIENLFDQSGGMETPAPGAVLPSGPVGSPPLPMNPGERGFTGPAPLGVPEPSLSERPPEGEGGGFGGGLLDFLGGVGRFIAHPIATVENMNVDQTMADRINASRLAETDRRRGLGFELGDPTQLSIEDIKMANYQGGNIFEDTRIPDLVGEETDLLSDRLTHERGMERDEHQAEMSGKAYQSQVDSAFDIASKINQQIPRHAPPENYDHWLPDVQTTGEGLIPDLQIKERMFGGIMADDRIRNAMEAADQMPEARYFTPQEKEGIAQGVLHALELQSQNAGMRSDQGDIARQFWAAYQQRLMALAREKKKDALSPLGFKGNIGPFQIAGQTSSPGVDTDPQYYPQR